MKGVIGLGLPTVVMGLLAVVMPPAQAAALLVVPSFVTNLWQLASGPVCVPLLWRLWPLLLGICAGTWPAPASWLGDGRQARDLALGVALSLYAVLGLCALCNSTVPARGERWLSAVGRHRDRLITAATGVFVIPAGPYLQALGLEKDELVQALGLSFTVSTVALAVVLACDGGSLEVAIAGVIGAGDHAGAARHGARAMAARAGASRAVPTVLSSSGCCCSARTSSLRAWL